MSERVTAVCIVGSASNITDSVVSSMGDIEAFAAEAVPRSAVGSSIDDADAVIVIDDPPTCDGVGIYRDIRAAGSNVPVFLVAADLSPDRLETALSAGVTEYVEWDGNSAALAARIRAHIRNPVLDGTVEARRWRGIIGSFAHDMKNPLNVVAGRLELLDVDGTHGEAVERSIGRVESLLDEISAVADAAGPEDQTAAVDIAETAERVWSEIDSGSATLVTETAQTVAADRDAVAFILQRLLENAVTHGGDGVTVTVGDAADGFSVADDGPGIPEADRDRVFEQGYGTTPHGEGYGLFVAARIARANGWEITLSESEDGGARFDVHDR